MSPEDRWNNHIATDRRWRIVFLWAIGVIGIIVAVIATVAIIAAVRAYENTKALERANCTIIRLVDAGVASEEQAAKSGRRLLKASPASQRPARLEIVKRHEARASRGKLFADSLRKDVNCPVRNN